MARLSTATASTQSSGSLPASGPEGAWARPPVRARWEIAAVAAAVLVGLWLRLNGYAQVPSITQNADELQFAWLGISLFEHGIPLTWAYLGPYSNPDVIHLHGTAYPLVHPWFDHPPLWGLITGGAALLAGQHTFAEVDMSAVRLPGIFLSATSIALVYELGRRILGVGPGVVAAVLVAIATPLVLMSRVAEPEALIAPLFLLSLVLTHRQLTGEGGRWGRAALAAICVVAPLAKLTGLVIPGAVGVIFVMQGRYRPAALCAAGGALSLAIFAAYGAAFGWHTFVAATSAQDAHRSGVMSGLEFIASYSGNNHHLFDGWWVLGWIGVGAIAVGRSDREGLVLAWPAIAYLVVITVLANQAWVGAYGWYRVGAYPLIYLGAAALAWRLVSSPSPAVAFLVLALGGATAAEFWMGLPWRAPAKIEFLVFGAALLPAVLAWRRGARSVGAALLGLMALGSLLQSLQLNQLADLF